MHPDVESYPPILRKRLALTLDPRDSVRNQIEGIALEHPRAYHPRACEGPVLACSALEPCDVRAYGRFAGTLQRRPLMDGDRLGPFNRATTP